MEKCCYGCHHDPGSRCWYRPQTCDNLCPFQTSQIRSTTASCIRLRNPNAQQLEEYNKQNPEKNCACGQCWNQRTFLYGLSQQNNPRKCSGSPASSGPQTKEIVYFINHVGPIGTEMESHRGRESRGGKPLGAQYQEWSEERQRRRFACKTGWD